MIITIIILLLISNEVHADEWTHSDTAMQVLYSGLHVADWNQTLQIANSNKYREDNALLGDDPSKDHVNLYFASTLAGHYYIAKKLDQPYRFLWQILWINRQYSAIKHNRKIGLNVGFKF